MQGEAMRRVGISVLAGSVVMFAAAVSGAQTAPSTKTYVYIDSGVLHVSCVLGNNNIVTIKDSGSKVIVTDVVGLQLFNETCKLNNATTATCDRPPNTIVVDLNDGNDVITNASSVFTVIDGGDGE
jgi:hypothetical protein